MEKTADTTLAQRLARHQNSPRATSANICEGELRLTLTNGAKIAFEASKIRPLAGLTQEQLADVRVTVGGTVLLWPQAGASIALEALLESLTGLQTLKSAGRKGGAARSEAKVAAVRANGAKGGRPRKSPVGA